MSLLLKFKLNTLFTILLGVTLREYGIYELSHGRKRSTKFSCCFRDPYLQLFPELVGDRRYSTMLLATVRQ